MPALTQGPMGVFDRLETSHARADDDTDPVEVCAEKVQLRIPNRHLGGSEREMDEAIIPSRLARIHPGFGTEVADLTSDARGQGARVEPSQWANARTTMNERIP